MALVPEKGCDVLGRDFLTKCPTSHELVYFEPHLKEETSVLAKGFDVVGTVKNLPDGRVEMEVMGEEEEVEDFIHEIVVESAVASGVKHHVVQEMAPLEDCRGFSIVK